MNRLKDTSLTEIIRAHKIARAVHDDQQMAFIEDTLTNINYDAIRDLMRAGEYVKAAELHRASGDKD